MAGLSETRTIAWDVDDVLNELTRAWFGRWTAAGRAAPAGGYEGLSANPPHEALGLGRDDYLASLDAFRASPEGLDLPPRPEALAWFEAHGGDFRHIALTATPVANAPASASWVMRHFGRWIHTYHVVPSPRAGDRVAAADADKAGFLAWLGRVDLVVDDSADVVRAADGLGIATVLFPQPWNDAAGDAADAFASVVPLLRSRGEAAR